LVIAGASVSKSEAGDEESAVESEFLDRCLRAALVHLPVSKAAAIGAAVVGVPRAQAYARAMMLKELKDR